MRLLAGTAMMGVALAGAAAQAEVTCWAVPALSNEMRLPDREPTDGEKGGALCVVACRDEFEPASFVLRADADLSGVTVAASDLKQVKETGEGEERETGVIIPKAKVDLKVIKVWYQNCNAWYSYFNDVGLKLCPELLLNDENLVKVDEAKKANFVRVSYDGKEDYVWVSPPADIDPGFKTRTEPVNDAKTIQPFALEKGRFKQFFATFRIDKDAKPGLYAGKIAVAQAGKTLAEIPVRLRVMKYVLPDPKTYYDTTADFYTMLYCVPGMSGYVEENGKDRKQSDAKQYARLKNQYDHNVRYPLYFGMWNDYQNLEYVENAIKQARAIGMKLDPF